MTENKPNKPENINTKDTGSNTFDFLKNYALMGKIASGMIFLGTFMPAISVTFAGQTRSLIYFDRFPGDATIIFLLAAAAMTYFFNLKKGFTKVFNGRLGLISFACGVITLLIASYDMTQINKAMQTDNAFAQAIVSNMVSIGPAFGLMIIGSLMLIVYELREKKWTGIVAIAKGNESNSNSNPE